MMEPVEAYQAKTCKRARFEIIEEALDKENSLTTYSAEREKKNAVGKKIGGC